MRNRIHPTAVIDPRAQIADDVVIGPYVVIEGEVHLAAGCKVAAHAVLQGNLFVEEGTQFGCHCVIGADPQDRSFDTAVDSGVKIGKKNIIRELVTIHRSSKAGEFTVIGEENFFMAGAHVGHDSIIGSWNNIANNVLFAGHVIIGDHCFFGGGAGVHQFVRVGDLALMQGNSGISLDLPPFSVVGGINELAGLNVIGLRRSGVSVEARVELKKVWRQLLRNNEPMTKVLEQLQQQEWQETTQKLIEFCTNPSRKGLMRMAGTQ